MKPTGCNGLSALLAALACAAAQAAAPNAGVDDISQGTMDSVGGWVVGVESVPRASTSVARARLAVAAYASGVPAEFTLELAAHELVPLADGLHRLLAISPGDASHRGHITLALTPEVPNPSAGQAVLVLARDARLRLNGPDIHGASDMAVSRWAPDQVDVQWRPSQYVPEDTDPADIKRATLHVGSRLQIGAVSLHVLAIEPESADHPQWVRFEASTALGRR